MPADALTVPPLLLITSAVISSEFELLSDPPLLTLMKQVVHTGGGAIPVGDRRPLLKPPGTFCARSWLATETLKAPLRLIVPPCKSVSGSVPDVQLIAPEFMLIARTLRLTPEAVVSIRSDPPETMVLPPLENIVPPVHLYVLPPGMVKSALPDKMPPSCTKFVGADSGVLTLS